METTVKYLSIYLVCRQSLFIYITWFVCNTLFIFRIVCFFNGLIYFSALLFQSKFLYLGKHGDDFYKFFMSKLSLIKFIKTIICQLVSHFVSFPTNLSWSWSICVAPTHLVLYWVLIFVRKGIWYSFKTVKDHNVKSIWLIFLGANLDIIFYLTVKRFLKFVFLNL